MNINTSNAGPTIPRITSTANKPVGESSNKISDIFQSGSSAAKGLIQAPKSYLASVISNNNITEETITGGVGLAGFTATALASGALSSAANGDIGGLMVSLSFGSVVGVASMWGAAGVGYALS